MNLDIKVCFDHKKKEFLASVFEKGKEETPLLVVPTREIESLHSSMVKQIGQLGEKSTDPCPAKDLGGIFGKTCDQYGTRCDKCSVWFECDRLTQNR